MSVVLGTYDGEPHLKEQLRSLAAQTHLPSELIVSDDSSRDETVRLVDEFASAAPFPVVVRRNEVNLGYGENFLRAAALATGDFIAFCDQDDVWAPDKLQVAVSALSSSGATLVVHRAWTIDAQGRRTGRFDQRIRRSRLHAPLSLGPWTVFYGFTMVFRREVLEVFDVDDRGVHTFENTGALSHDLWIYFLAESLGMTLLLTDRLASYRQHGRNATPSVVRGGLRAWTTSLGVAVRPRLRRDLIASARADLFERLAARSTSPVVVAAASQARRRWRAVEQAEAARIVVYSEPTAPLRLWAWARLVVRGGYGRSVSGGLGGRLALKDLIAGVAGVRREPLGRSSPSAS